MKTKPVIITYTKEKLESYFYQLSELDADDTVEISDTDCSN
jgi:hypothetical protein